MVNPLEISRLLGASALLAAAALLTSSPAAAQAPDPGGFVCALVNFQFCDQPPAPIVEPDMAPAPPAAPAHAAQRKPRRKQTAAPSE